MCGVPKRLVERTEIPGVKTVLTRQPMKANDSQFKRMLPLFFIKIEQQADAQCTPPLSQEQFEPEISSKRNHLRKKRIHQNGSEIEARVGSWQPLNNYEGLDPFN